MTHRPPIGLVPAAGRAARLGALPCSKEIFPVGFDDRGVPTPVARHLLRGFAAAGIDRALVILRPGKWDVPACLGAGLDGVDLAYLVVEGSGSVPETLDRAARWIEGCDVALGFPDILLEPSDVWPRLLDFHRRGGHDASLGLVPTDQAWKADMVDADDDGRVRGFVIKDPECTLRWTWSIALWTPSVTELLRRRVARGRDGDAELWVGDVLRDAVAAGLDVRGLRFAEGTFLDIGTPADLRRAVGGSAGDGTP
ncbi:MAG: hypothetical protein AAGN66_05980 [Acidobacteriota bacterium]